MQDLSADSESVACSSINASNPLQLIFGIVAFAVIAEAAGYSK